MSNLAKYNNGKALVEDLQSRADDLAKYAAAGCNLPRLMQGMASVVAKNPAILRCDRASLLSAVRHCAQLGLDPSSPLNRIHIVPFGATATVVVGYGGLQELALRSGLVRSIDAHNIYRGEEYEIRKGSEMTVKHVVDPSVSHADKDIVLTYAIARLKDATHPIIETMTREEIEGIRKGSKMANGPAWSHGWGEMARKTVIRRIAKRLPQTPDLDLAFEISDRSEGYRDRPADDAPRSEAAMNIENRLAGRPEVEPEPEAETTPAMKADELVGKAHGIIAAWSGIGGSDLKGLVRDIGKAAGITAKPPLSEGDANLLLDACERVASDNKFPDISAAKPA
jgi:phage RecT family recombinase